MTDSMARTIARYAVADFGAADPRVRDEARRRVLDSVGVAMAALDHPGPRAVRAYARTMATGSGSRLWGTDLLVPPEIAALANGVAVRCLDFNDAYFSRDSTHPSDMIPGLLAVAEERGCSGAGLLDAIAVGYEVAVATCDAFGVRTRGWDQTNITAMGACAGTARLLGLDAEQAGHALAMTVVPRAGMLQARYGNVAMWKGFGGPDSVRSAIYACLLAEAGVEGPSEPFEGPKGFVALLLDGHVPDRGAVDRLAELPAPSKILDTHIKRWPVGYVAQSAVEAAYEVQAQLRPGDRITSVEIATYGMAVEVMASREKFAPTTRETADHSLPYVVAAMLQDGDISEASFDLERVRSPDVHRFLRERVTVVEDPSMTARYPMSFPARVEVLTDEGPAWAAHVDDPPGSARNPLSDAALEHKFHRLCGGVLGDRAAEIIATIDDLAAAEDVRPLARLLAVAPEPAAPLQV